MKYEVKRACGHVEKVELFGPHKDREWRLKKEAEKKCLQCRANTAVPGLPMLEGTPKQVAWANDIRSNILRQVESLRSEIDRLFPDHPETEKVTRAIEGFVAELVTKTSASWWIDNRTMAIREEILKRLN
ncbi:hypothetical protein [Thermogutta sp.]|uniref:hypothetical protein n=1 Tax=Thermogutta sp. TaxID=1962930 RepID=UPI00321FDF12